MDAKDRDTGLVYIVLACLFFDITVIVPFVTTINPMDALELGFYSLILFLPVVYAGLELKYA